MRAFAASRPAAARQACRVSARSPARLPPAAARRHVGTPGALLRRAARPSRPRLGATDSGDRRSGVGAERARRGEALGAAFRARRGGPLRVTRSGPWDADEDEDDEVYGAGGDVQYSPWGESEFVVHDDAVPSTFKFDPTQRVKLKVSADKLERAMRRARRDFVYEHTLSELCIELVKLQEYIKAKGLKVVVIFEGRDAAGKGGVISRIASAMSPRICRVVALSAPSDRERTQWYFQRYVAHLPSAGEIVLFDRSWYNRAGVEKVMGFCTPQEYEAFMEDVPNFERMLVEHGGITVIKFWLDVSDFAQERRFEGRLHRIWKRWKLSPMDLYARSRWTEYARARDAMLKRTDHPAAPWIVVPSDNKKAARLNCISYLLSRIEYTEMETAPLSLPPRDSADTGQFGSEPYVQPPDSAWKYVPALYDSASLSTAALCDEECMPETPPATVPRLLELDLELHDDEEEDERYAHAGDA